MTGSPPLAFPGPAHAPGKRRGRGLARVAALALALLAPGARASDADLCLLAAQDAARLSGVPLSVLLGITLTETGRGEGGTTRPWPWTVNMEGEGHWFATRDEALAFAEARHAGGATSFDVGCFQVNWRWHNENFTGLPQMFDPLANASYAARFLRELYDETGDWSAAAGAYHSRTPENAQRYRATFDAHRASAIAAGADQGRLDVGTAVAQAPAPRANTFPLLTDPAGAPRLGSLVPIDG